VLVLVLVLRLLLLLLLLVLLLLLLVVLVVAVARRAAAAVRVKYHQQHKPVVGLYRRYVKSTSGGVLWGLQTPRLLCSSKPSQCEIVE
jgi:hypothetical protein